MQATHPQTRSTAGSGPAAPLLLAAAVLNPWTLPELPAQAGGLLDLALIGAALLPRGPSRRSVRIALLLGYVLFLLLLLEGTARLYWKVEGRIPVLGGRLIHYFYPQLEALEHKRLDPQDGAFDVLLLGASTLNSSVGSIEPILREELARRTRRVIRTHNLAVPAHMSRDSLYKYEALEAKRFDLVVLYDGMNDVRANNFPPDGFREDYSHHEWYALLAELQRHRESRLLRFPYTLRHLGIRAADALGLADYAPQNQPNGKWLQHGRTIKTARTFRANVERILEIAKGRQEPVVLMSFASYIPADYSPQRFAERSLDYTLHISPIEIWGSVQNVRAGLISHNLVLEALAQSHPEAIFVDQERLIPKGRLYFNDVCHLTNEGCRKFVENLLGPVLQRLRPQDGP